MNEPRYQLRDETEYESWARRRRIETARIRLAVGTLAVLMLAIAVWLVVRRVVG